MGAVLSLYYLYLDNRYGFEAYLCKYSYSLVNEMKADEAMLLSDDAEAIASGLMKVQLLCYHEWEEVVYDEAPVFAPQEPGNIISDGVDLLRRKMTERGEDWLRMASVQLTGKKDSHPSARERLENLGITELKLMPFESEPLYVAEAEKAARFADGLIRSFGITGGFGNDGVVVTCLLQVVFGKVFRIAAQHNVRAAAGHVGGDGHRAELSGLSDNFRFLFMILGIQHRVWDSALFEQGGKILAFFD